MEKESPFQLMVLEQLGSLCKRMNPELTPYTKINSRDFPGGPVVKTPCFQCKERRLDPWSGN